MKRWRRIILVAGLIAAAVWWFWPSRSRQAAEEQGQPMGRSNGLAPVATGAVDGKKENRLSGPGPVERIHAVLEVMRRAGGAEESQRILDELRFFLGTLTPSEASKTVRGFLDTHLDTPTQLGFGIGPDGLLKAAPSLRVFLLDYLATVDGAGAADYAQQVLSSPSSADEWAVAMRNYAWGNRTAESRSYLEAKFTELVQNESWRERPSSGFLEAFDVAVYVGTPGLVAPLMVLMGQTNNPAASHAAFLALDRMTLKDSAGMLGEMLRQPETMKGHEGTRANYFARANVQDEQQRRVLEGYLLSPWLSPGELEAFAGVYPNGNFMISHNLLTKTLTLDRATLARRDRRALEVVNDWLAQARFEKVKPHLENVRRRLEIFVEQAKDVP